MWCYALVKQPVVVFNFYSFTYFIFVCLTRLSNCFFLVAFSFSFFLLVYFLGVTVTATAASSCHKEGSNKLLLLTTE